MEYIFFAGANGSGKTTFIRSFMRLDEYKDYRYICADEIERDLMHIPERQQRMLIARNAAISLREELLRAGKDVIFESVASHPSHLDDLERIKGMGYKITTVYVTNESHKINLNRIAMRGRDNDSYLTAERVQGRYERGLGLLSQFIERSDSAFVFDNSVNYVPVFAKTQSGVHYLITTRLWSEHYVSQALEGDGTSVLAAKDLSEESYLALLNKANAYIEYSTRISL